MIYFLLLLLVSCVSTAPLPSEKGVFEKDLKMDVFYWKNAWTALPEIQGVGVIPQASHYKIRIRPEGGVDLLTVTSCHREWKSSNPDRSGGGLFKKGYYEFDIAVSKEHEIARACPFETGIYEKDKGRHGWGMLVVDSPRENVPATLRCNGKIEQFNGTSVCQSRERLLQSIHFDKPMQIVAQADCEMPVPEDKKNFLFQMPLDRCVFYFVDESDPDELHKLVTYGYSHVIIRED